MVCVETHANGHVPGSPVFLRGVRLSPDHPAVKGCPELFLPESEATEDRISAYRSQLFAGDYVQPQDPSREEEPGRVRRRDEWRPTRRGADRERDDDTQRRRRSVRAVYKGQWVRRDDLFVKLHPLLFTLPALELAG